MPITIEEVTLIPHPIPSSGGLVRATCRVSSDAKVKSVTAYPAMGEPVPLVPRNATEYIAEEYIPPGTMPGTYEVTVIAMNEAGNEARKRVPVTIE